MHWYHPLITCLLAVLSSARAQSSTPSSTQSAAAPAFTYDRSSFLLHGAPHVIIGGQMDPQRIPATYWRDRLRKARAMGLNTIFSYVYWNLLEPIQGQWTSAEEGNNVAKFFAIAQEEGLHVVLRPGPYICGEREWGGFPAWLSTVPGLTVRSSDDAFMEAAESYLERLAADLRPLQVTQGGPLLMVQVENEYGSYGTDHNYTRGLRDILRRNFEVPLYTNDGGVDWTLAGGEVPGVLAEIDGDPRSGFAARDLYITDPSELGPLLDGEYYTLAPDTWGSANAHNTAAGNAAQVQQFVSDLDLVLGANNSISLYMFHGGTNFAFSNGAIWRNYTAAFTTSYDYGAPLDESGRTTELYDTLRDTIAKYVPEGSIPQPPANVPLSEFANVTLKPVGGLFGGDVLGVRRATEAPVTMEELGQAYGLVLYEHMVTTALEGTLQPGDRARDRVIVYVNGTKQGVIDSTYAQPAEVSLSLQPGDTLQLLIENLGRVDYWSRESGTFIALEDPYKGIVGNVTVGSQVLSGWDIYSLPLDAPPAAGSTSKVAAITTGSPPVFFSGTFRIDGGNTSDPMMLDTFLAVPDGVKGNVWVNGFNLGRYWIVGPQQSLYLPRTVLKTDDDNEIVVLELEPNAESLTAFGTAERTWANYPDPDYP
ncbi:glycoside hydrolase family 35 protein [Annulohypoxylon truncatum]|uniref:glycoside hydrolase family 35 protein n=1 Tax=Annulohypoxylon truncatum TaxID=327061 RepID=UPI0020079971|nr:glycoside hydrolase family 35 protein [Annulohypoxylon truncatum]KAI1207280.1 glycoside hydrolase family 35 protein [Annulohypoxylon truncatum]